MERTAGGRRLVRTGRAAVARPRCGGGLSSAVVIAPARPPAPLVGTTARIGGECLDLGKRVLVAGVVPAPRFGREAEVQAGAAAVLALGADLVDVPPPARFAGVVAGTAGHHVSVRVSSVDQVVSARAAGVEVIMASLALTAALAGGDPAVTHHDRDSAGGPAGLAGVVVLVDDPAGVPAGRAQAERWSVPLAFDSTHWSGAAATAREAAAVAAGCRLLRSNAVRRSRRVAEVTGALLAARRQDDRPGEGLDGDQDQRPATGADEDQG